MNSGISKILGLIVLITTSFVLHAHPTEAAVTEPVRITEENLMVIPQDANTLTIVQVMTIVNDGKETVSQLPVYLPDNHSELSLLGDLKAAEVTETERGVIIESGLAAESERQVMLTYQMPMEDLAAQFTIEQALITENLQVIIQPGVLSFTASDLMTQSDLFEMNGQEYRRFTRLNLHPGEPWRLSFQLIADLSAPASAGEGTSPSEAVSAGEQKVTSDGYPIIGRAGIGYGKAAITILLIIIAFSAALIGLKRDMASTISKKKSKNTQWLLAEKEQLLSELFQLEKDYQGNLVGRQTYDTTKEQLRNRLIQLTTEFQKRAAG